jgi:hypothetical protein
VYTYFNKYGKAKVISDLGFQIKTLSKEGGGNIGKTRLHPAHYGFFVQKRPIGKSNGILSRIPEGIEYFSVKIYVKTTIYPEVRTLTL